jgi:hypothetical protein
MTWFFSYFMSKSLYLWKKGLFQETLWSDIKKLTFFIVKLLGLNEFKRIDL